MAESSGNAEINVVQDGTASKAKPDGGTVISTDNHASLLASEVTNTGDSLYPNVKHVIVDLKRIADESTEFSAIPLTPLGEPILSFEIMQKWVNEEGFSDGKRGTYHNADTYLYLKACNLIEKEEDVDQAIATARNLSSLGAIHPESQWGVYKTENAYQLFVVSPKLVPWHLEEELSGKYDDRTHRPMQDNSHLLAWYKRIDPNFVPGQPIPEDSVLYHLNWTEASNRDNWGWDARGELFPVDVEVLHPTKPFFKDHEPWKSLNTDLSDIDLI